MQAGLEVMAEQGTTSSTSLNNHKKSNHLQTDSHTLEGVSVEATAACLCSTGSGIVIETADGRAVSLNE
jgi:hypothetical protein